MSLFEIVEFFYIDHKLYIERETRNRNSSETIVKKKKKSN